MSRGYSDFVKAAKKNRREAQSSNPRKTSLNVNRRMSSGVSALGKSDVDSELERIFSKELSGNDRKGNLGVQKKTKTRSKKHSSNLSLVGVLGAGLIIAAYGFIFPERFVEVFNSIEVGFMSESRAASPKTEVNKAPDKSKVSAKESIEGLKSGSRDKAEKRAVPSEELSHFSKLTERKQELDQREEELAELEEELHKQKLEIDARISKLEKIRSKISGILKERVKIDKEKVKRLVEFYSSMKPKQAAGIVGSLNEDLAVEILGQMKKKSAASIMNLLDPKKARVLSEKFAGYQRR